MGNTDLLGQSLVAAGWFIPPYIQLRHLHAIAADARAQGTGFAQDDLEAALAPLYDADSLAAMVLHRYPSAPVIKDFKETIAEAVEAHFGGLGHVAVGGLVPVVEGAGRRLAAARGLPSGYLKAVFTALAEDCKRESAERGVGNADEIAAMMNSFRCFITDLLYVSSDSYPLSDKTNRHGITHGAYTDADYGRPINFYKTIAAVDFLTFVSSFSANISWFAPEPTRDSMRLADHYRALARLQASRPAVP